MADGIPIEESMIILIFRKQLKEVKRGFEKNNCRVIYVHVLIWEMENDFRRMFGASVWRQRVSNFYFKNTIKIWLSAKTQYLSAFSRETNTSIYYLFTTNEWAFDT